MGVECRAGKMSELDSGVGVSQFETVIRYGYAGRA